MRHLLIAFLATVLLAGCDQKPDKANHVTISSPNGSVNISGNGEHITMQSDNGKTRVEVNTNGIGGNVGLPAFVPLYPGAKVISSVHGNDAKSAGGMVAFDSKSTPADVIAFYKQKTAGAGLPQKMDMNQQGTMMFVASDEKRTLQVTSAPGDGGAGSHTQLTWSGG